MKWNIKNFKNGPIMSALGIIIILASVASVFVKSLGIDWTQAAVGCGIGITLLGLKDPNGGGNATAVALMLGVFAIVMVSCQPPINNTRVIETIYKDTTFNIKGGSVGQVVDDGELIKKILLAMKANGAKNPIYQTPANNNSNGFAKLTFKLDSLNRLYAQCDCKDSAFKATLKDIYDKEVKQVLVTKEVIPKWLIAIIIMMGGVVILLAIKVLFK